MSTLIAATDELLLQPALAAEVETFSPGKAIREVQARLEREIDIALERVDEPVVKEIAETILQEIVGLFGRLTLIEHNLHELDTLLENLSILEVVQFESRSLIDFITTKAMRTPQLNDQLHEVLDGISYSMIHDVRRIFERELVGSVRRLSTPVVYGKIVHAHGLLVNCLQQSAITLLQVLNPSLDSFGLFNDSEERLRQSLILCRELSSLIRLVRQAEAESTPDRLRTVVGCILEFRDGSMQYLMYRDWRAYERLALDVISSIENNGDSKVLLHQLECFLEVLYSHVKMRAVLKDMFHSSGEEEELATD
ncbi:MAG TPA: hypothetical protein VIV66_21965 [Pyrinomonadaceae bacterium]